MQDEGNASSFVCHPSNHFDEWAHQHAWNLRPFYKDGRFGSQRPGEGDHLPWHRKNLPRNKANKKKKKTKLSTGERMVLGIWFGYQGSVSLEPSLPRTSQFHKPSVSSFLPKPFWVGFLPFVVERLLSDTVLISLHQVQIILQGLFSGKPSHLFYFSLRFFFHYVFLHYNFISLISS